MQIILGKENAEKIGSKYIVLDLDTFLIDGEEIPSYCVLDASSIPLEEITQLSHWVTNHNKIMENYHKQNWEFCEQMIDHCLERWGGSMKSFYAVLLARILDLKTQDLPVNWTGVISN